MKLVACFLLLLGCLSCSVFAAREGLPQQGVSQGFPDKATSAGVGVGAAVTGIAGSAGTIQEGMQNLTAAMQDARAEAESRYRIRGNEGLTPEQRAEWIAGDNQRHQAESDARLQAFQQTSAQITAGYDESNKALLEQQAHSARASGELFQRLEQAREKRREEDARRMEMLRGQLENLSSSLQTPASSSASYLTAEGFIREWVEGYPAFGFTSFMTPMGTPERGAIQQKLNQFLRLRAEGMGRSDEKTIEYAQLGLETLVQADQLFGRMYGLQASDAAQSAQYKVVADRMLRRSTRLANFMTQSAACGAYRDKDIPAHLVSHFNLQPMKADGFENSEVVAVARYIEDSGLSASILDNEAMRFHVAIGLHQAQMAAGIGDVIVTVDSVDRVYAVVDYLKGFARGVYAFGEDTLSSVAQLLMHPLDSAEAIVDSIVHFDKTFAVISAGIRDVVDRYDTMDIGEKGHLHARIASELMSMFVPIGAVKIVGTAGRVAAGVAHVSEHVSPWLIKGMKGFAAGEMPTAAGQGLKIFRGDSAVQHFAKHAEAIMSAMGRDNYNLKDYIRDANHVVAEGQYAEELNAYVKLIGGPGAHAKAAFVGLSRDRKNVTTFHIKRVESLAVRAPSLGWKK